MEKMNEVYLSLVRVSGTVISQDYCSVAPLLSACLRLGRNVVILGVCVLLCCLTSCQPLAGLILLGTAKP